MIKIWGRANSVNVQKVLWTLRELGVPFERIDAGGAFGMVNDAEYRAMNPNGLVPTLQDGDMVLWESNAIVRYLAARYGKGEFYPRNLAVRADADRWMDWATITFGVHVGPLFMQTIRTAPDKRDPAIIANSRTQLAKLAQILDAHLAGRAFVAGNDFSMGDVPIGCQMYRYLTLTADGGSTAEMPNVAAWYARLRARPAYREVVMLPLT